MNDDALITLQALMARLEGAYAEATLRAYRADFEHFIRYCEKEALTPWPATAEAVAGFVGYLALSGLRSASIRRAVGGIATLHNLSRLKDPTKDPEVRLAMRRMHRQLGRGARQAGAIDARILEQLLNVTDASAKGLRDRALLLVGYDTLCRRSELTSLRVEDLRPRKILLRRSKTDPEAVGRWLFLSPRSDQAVRAWIEAAGLLEGPIFCSTPGDDGQQAPLNPGQVNRILKRLARRADLDPALVSGHSLRIGAAQDLLQKGASLPDIMHRGRWSKTDTVMRYLEGAPVKFEEEDEPSC